MEKGTVPQSKPAESTPATQAGAPSGDKPAAESAPASQEHNGKGADARKAQLNAEIQDLLKKRADLRAEVEPKKDATAASSPAGKTPKLEKPVKPVFGEIGHDGETWDQYEARRDTFTAALIKYEANELIVADREKRESERLESDTKAANKVIEDGWNERVTAVKSKHADWAEVALSKDYVVSPVMDGFILDSDVGPEMLYYFGTHLDEANAIALMSPYKAARALHKIEISLVEPAAEPAKRAPVTPITKAAKPAIDLKATNGAAVDLVRKAVDDDDFTAFAEEQNRRDVARRKQG